MSLINREALYEKACDLEAQALSYIAKIANDKTKIDEWKIWSAILIERTGFKHDIFDALEELPSVQPEIIRCKDCKHWDGVDTCDVIDAPVWDNDFCSMAERRSDE